MPEFVIIGGGGHASVVATILAGNGLTVIGYTSPVEGQPPGQLRYLGPDPGLSAYAKERNLSAALGIGKVVASSRRLELLREIEDMGIAFPPIVANSAVVHPDAHLGPGAVVMDGAIVATGTRLGRGCIVNTHATVDHDCDIGDDVHLAPGSVVSGDVTIGPGCLIGANATVIQSLKLCAGVTVGAGATVVRDIHEPGVYLGTPARRSP